MGSESKSKSKASAVEIVQLSTTGRSTTFCVCSTIRVTAEEQTTSEAMLLGMNVSRRCTMKVFYKLIGLRYPSSSFLGGLRIFLAGCCCDILPIFCCPPVPKRIVAKIALITLKTPSYDFMPFGARDPSIYDKRPDFEITRDLSIQHDYRIRLTALGELWMKLSSRRYQSHVAHVRCFYTTDKFGNRVACAYVPANGLGMPDIKDHRCPHGSWTVLFSHSNGSDLGVALGYAFRLARRFCINVLVYDYVGFGRSGGKATENGIYSAAEAAYEFLIKTMRVPADKIILIGTSLGTCASIHLASTRSVKAVVLQGAFLSAYRVIIPVKRRVSNCDQYLNVEKIARVNVPTLIVHGEKDELFRLRHAKLLHQCCPGAAKIEPCYIEGGSHIDFDLRPDYWKRLHKFLHRELVPYTEELVCCGNRVDEWRRKKKEEESELSKTIDASSSLSGCHYLESHTVASKVKTRSVIVCVKCLQTEEKKKTSKIPEGFELLTPLHPRRQCECKR